LDDRIFGPLCRSWPHWRRRYEFVCLLCAQRSYLGELRCGRRLILSFKRLSRGTLCYGIVPDRSRRAKMHALSHRWVLAAARGRRIDQWNSNGRLHEPHTTSAISNMRKPCFRSGSSNISGFVRVTCASRYPLFQCASIVARENSNSLTNAS
jgi:hypothetical protein